MSCKSLSQDRSGEGFTPYQESLILGEKQLSLFSRLNLNERKDQSLISQIGANPNFNDNQSYDLFSMRSRKRKGSVEIQLKESLPGNKTFLNMSLIGKNSLINNDMFANEHYQDLASGQYYDDKKQLSEKSCPVASYYYADEESSDRKRHLNNKAGYRLESDSKREPRFHKTKNMLRTIGTYLHKFLIHNKRSLTLQRKYFQQKLLKKIKRKQMQEQNASIEAFSKIKLSQECQQPQYLKQQCQQHQYVKQQQQIVQKIIICEKDSKSKKIRKNQNSKSRQKSKDTKTIKQKKHIKQLTEQQLKTQKLSKNHQKQLDQKQTMEQLIKRQLLMFHEWLSNQSVINFADYQRIWTTDHEFLPLYRQMCYKYYKEQVYCDVMRSRLTTKHITNQYMYQFIQGLFNPKAFYKFR